MAFPHRLFNRSHLPIQHLLPCLRHTLLALQFQEPEIAGGDAKPPTVPVKMCILPADAVLASRADTLDYLKAQISNNAVDITTPANKAFAPYSPVGSCPTIAGRACNVRPAEWRPFKLIPEANMCTYTGATTKTNCTGPNDSQVTQPSESWFDICCFGVEPALPEHTVGACAGLRLGRRALLCVAASYQLAVSCT